MEPQLLLGRINQTEKDHCLHHSNKRNESSDELMILRALYLSQKRAEEAERKLQLTTKEKEKVEKLIVEISAKIYAHKNLATLIEMDSALLERRLKLERRSGNEKRVEQVAMLNWELGLVLLGFAGAGFVLGQNLAPKL